MPVPYLSIDVSETARKEPNHVEVAEDDAWLEVVLTETLEETFPVEEFQYSFRFD
ncbi:MULTISPECIES: hypothetical protein [unclassified Sinorhizobium]|uniref:hypothetical protein n=1 Tax=unclassified Sinorhizobium TaxID=2613772 RepID=UPI003525CF5D